MIPAALRRREAIARGLSIRLRAEARVLLGLCAEADKLQGITRNHFAALDAMEAGR